MKILYTLPLLVFTAACSHGHIYALPNSVESEVSMEFKGTVISLEDDGDFVMETKGKLLFVDTDDIEKSVEIGDRVIVSGETDNDIDEGEAPELNAESIEPWISDN